MASPLAVNHMQTSARTALQSQYRVCSVQPYGTVPYSHGTLDAWPRPRNPQNRMAASSASQPTTIQYSPFSWQWQNYISVKSVIGWQSCSTKNCHALLEWICTATFSETSAPKNSVYWVLKDVAQSSALHEFVLDFRYVALARLFDMRVTQRQWGRKS